MAIRGSLFLGVFLILVFLVTSNFKFLKIDDVALVLLGLSNQKELSLLWPFQFFTNNAIHLNLTHLVANLSGLSLTSLYERRVGTKRYLAVVGVSALSSGLSIFFFENAVVVCGISGAVFGLAASYFIDFDDVRRKDLVMAMISFAALFILLSFTSSNRMRSAGNADHVGHVLGAISGVLFCRYTRRSSRAKG